MKRIAYTSLTMLCVLSFALSQPVDTLWTRVYGGEEGDICYTMHQTADGGYILGGASNSYGPGPYSFWVVRVDSEGTLIWNDSYGGSGGDACYVAIEVADGFIFAGNTDSFGDGANSLIVKTDENGDTLWTRVYGGSIGQRDDCYSLIQTLDGGYVFAGRTESFGAGGYDFWIVKIDEYGNKSWSRTYGGNADEVCESILQVNDGGYILAGYTSTFGIGGYDFWLLKTDAVGDCTWSQTYGSLGDDKCYSVKETLDGGYVLCGSGWSSSSPGNRDMWIIKTNASGDSLWGNSFGGIQHDEARDVCQTADSGYVMFGQSASLSSSDKAFVVRVDMNGDSIWGNVYGGELSDVAFSGLQTSDLRYTMAGYTQSGGSGDADFWLVRLSADPLCGPLSGSIGPGTYYVSCPISVESGDTLTILPGTTLDFLGPYSFTINGTLLAQGTETDSIYFTTDTLSNPSKWRGLQFDHADNGCQLNYCVVELSWANETEPHDRGGGIWCNDASPAFSNCSIRHCIANDDAGGAYFRYNCNPVFEHCTFSSNYSGDAGAAAFSRDNCLLTFNDCTFSGNHADDEGGALSIGDSLSATGCEFNGNLSNKNGGAIYAADGGMLYLSGCSFTSNSATLTGGSIYCDDAYHRFLGCDFSNNSALTAGGVYCIDTDSTLFSNCTISGNAATGGSGTGAGGGIYFYATGGTASNRLEGCIITGNHSTGNGGGGVVCLHTPVLLNECTISGNFTTGHGGGIWSESTTAELTNTILWDNCADGIGDELYTYNVGSHADFLCCDVNSAGVEGTGSVNYIADNVFTDPLFCGPESCNNAPTTNGDYTISLCSPCSDFMSSCGLIGALDVGCGADPAPVEGLTDTPVYPDVILNWSPVTTTTCGAPQDVDYYLIYFESESLEDWDFLAYTADTTYTHYGVVQFSDLKFYMVEAYIGSIGVLETIPDGIKLTREDIQRMLK